MNIIKDLILIISILVISACHKDRSKTKSLRIIDIENNMNKMEVINLSQFASNIHYIPLETNNGISLSYIDNCMIFGNYMIVTNLRQCLLYNKQGKFLGKLGQKEEETGEYRFVNVVDFDSDTNIYLQSLRDLLEYRIDGTPINKTRNNLYA